MKSDHILESARQYLAGTLLLCALALPGCGGNDDNGFINPTASPTLNPPIAGTSLRFVSQPGLSSAGSPVTPTVQVEVLDANGQRLTSAVQIDLFLANNPTGANLTNSSATTVNGVATFSGLSVSKPGIGYTLVATGAGVPPTTSSPFNVALAGQNLSLFNNSQSLALAPALGSGSANADFRAVVAGDFNGDGLMDQALVHGVQNNLRIQTRRADGGYENRDTNVAGIMQLLAGDVDGDGDLDLVALRSGTFKSVFLNNGDGSFAAPVDSDAPTGTRSIALADIDGDNDLDLVTTGTSVNVGATTPAIPGEREERNLVQLFANDGTGSFGASGVVVAPFSTDVSRTSRTGGTVVVGNFDAAPGLDIATLTTNPAGTGAPTAGNNNLVLFRNVNPATGAYTTVDILSVGVAQGNLRSMRAGDFNGDGSTDLVVAVNNGLRIFTNSGTSTPFAAPTAVSATAPAAAFSIPAAPTTSPFATNFHNSGALVVANLDDDAADEIAFVDSTQNTVRVFYSMPGATNPISYQAPVGPTALTVADFNGDNRLDLGVANRSGSTNAVSLFTTLLNRGNSQFGPQRLGIDADNDTVTDSSSGQRVKVADVNGDGLPDLIVAVPARQQVQIWHGSANGEYAAAPDTTIDTLGARTGSTPGDVLVADVDGANGNDLVVLDSTFGESNVRFFTNNGSGSFSENTSSALTFSDKLMGSQGAILNADGDADPEILVTSGTPAEFILINGSFPYDLSETTTFSTQGIGDFITANVDGNPGDDIVGIGPNSTALILHNDGSGNFSSTTTLNSPSGVLTGPTQKVAVGDLNGDGVIDIAASQGNSGGVAQVVYWLSDGQGNYEASQVSSNLIENAGASASQFGGLAIGDVNGDGLQDIVVGGQASANIAFFLNRGGVLFQPANVSFASGRLSHLTLADLDGDGDLDIVGAAAGGAGGVYPLLQR